MATLLRLDSRAERQRPGGVRMNQTLASNLQAAFIKRPHVKLVVDAGGNHSSKSWASRIPDAISFLFGDADAMH